MAGTVYVDPLHRVAVAGGTHGNEMSGVFLVKHWLKHSSQLVSDTVSAVPLLSNPKASEKGVRYYEKDLNRCFTLDILSAPDSPDDPYEVLRAKEINRLFGPRGSADAYDMIVDLHNTTSNMGVCLIVSGVQNAVEMHACQYIQTHLPHYNPRIFVYAKPGTDLYSVVSVAKCGLGMEFPAFETDTYQCTGQVDFPRSSDGEMSAIIHPSLQDKDFSLLHPGDLIFLTLDGQSIPYSGEKPIYPVFINEAAYYEKKIAFILAEKIRVSVPALRRKMH